MPRFGHPPGLGKVLLYSRNIGLLMTPIGQHVNCEDLISQDKYKVSGQVYVSPTLHQGNPSCPFDGKLGGPPNQFGCCGEEKSLMLSLGIKLQFLGHHDKECS
jgi:hypothetical protein